MRQYASGENNVPAKEHSLVAVLCATTTTTAVPGSTQDAPHPPPTTLSASSPFTRVVSISLGHRLQPYLLPPQLNPRDYNDPHGAPNDCFCVTQRNRARGAGETCMRMYLASCFNENHGNVYSCWVWRTHLTASIDIRSWQQQQQQQPLCTRRRQHARSRLLFCPPSSLPAAVRLQPPVVSTRSLACVRACVLRTSLAFDISRRGFNDDSYPLMLHALHLLFVVELWARTTTHLV